MNQGFKPFTFQFIFLSHGAKSVRPGPGGPKYSVAHKIINQYNKIYNSLLNTPFKLECELTGDNNIVNRAYATILIV